MRLLIYSHFFRPSVGGVETIVATLADGLARLGAGTGKPDFDVTLVTETASDSREDLTEPYRVIRLPALWELIKLIRQSDIVHLAGPAFLPLILARILHKPTVIEHHGYQSICLNGQLLLQPELEVCPGYFQARKYNRCLSCEAAQVGYIRGFKSLMLQWPRYLLSYISSVNIAVSDHVRRRLNLPRTFVVYHGVELPTGEVGVSLEDSGAMRFAYVGRFVTEKGVRTLLEAARIVATTRVDFEVLLIGDGPLRSELQSVIDSTGLKDRVQVLGFLDQRRLQEALRNVPVVIMPTISEETAGLAALEQMSRGRLVIASAIGGLKEAVVDAGLLFTPGNAAELADRMRSVLENPKLIDSLGKAAQLRASKMFEVNRMIREHVEIYRSLCATESGN